MMKMRIGAHLLCPLDGIEPRTSGPEPLDPDVEGLFEGGYPPRQLRREHALQLRVRARTDHRCYDTPSGGPGDDTRHKAGVQEPFHDAEVICVRVYT